MTEIRTNRRAAPRAWIAVASVLRYSSVAALTASLAAPVALLVQGHEEWAAMMAILTAILWARHYANIRRLIAGQETRIGSRAA